MFDRFLVSEKLIVMWEVTNLKVGRRELSDHCPIWLLAGWTYCGPKPFRFNNSWLKNDKFSKFVEEE